MIASDVFFWLWDVLLDLITLSVGLAELQHHDGSEFYYNFEIKYLRRCSKSSAFPHQQAPIYISSGWNSPQSSSEAFLCVLLQQQISGGWMEGGGSRFRSRSHISKTKIVEAQSSKDVWSERNKLRCHLQPVRQVQGGTGLHTKHLPLAALPSRQEGCIDEHLFFTFHSNFDRFT